MHDVIIIGAGPAGLSAAVWCEELGLDALLLEREEEFRGRGVLESGVRDRDAVAGQDVCVVGGGDAAAENALLLAEVCPTVTLVHRGRKLSARAEFVERIRGEHCITVFTEAELRRI